MVSTTQLELLFREEKKRMGNTKTKNKNHQDNKGDVSSVSPKREETIVNELKQMKQLQKKLWCHINWLVNFVFPIQIM